MDENYNVHWIKKGKKRRCISEPKEKIRPYLNRLFKELSELYNAPSYVHGFVSGKNTYTNALPHCNRPWVATVDIRDFFPSTTMKQITMGLLTIDPEMFQRNETSISYHWISRYCFFTNKENNRELSQGSPCSPVLCNIAFIPYDDKISKMCDILGISYTRYADDLTFSVKKKRDKILLSYLVDKWLPKNVTPYQIHPRKVKFRNQNQRQEVTGLIVNNEKPRPKKEYRNTAKVVAHKHENQQASQAKHNGFQSYLHIDSPNQEENKCQNYETQSQTLTPCHRLKGHLWAMVRLWLRAYLMLDSQLCGTTLLKRSLFRFRRSRSKKAAKTVGSTKLISQKTELKVKTKKHCKTN